MRPARPLPTIIAFALLLALVACGTGKDETAISNGLEKALTSTSVSACSSSYTKAFLDQGSYGSTRAAAELRTFCRSNIKELAAKQVDVSDVRVDGDTAEADFSATGGQYAYKHATVTLRKSGGEWRLDRLKALELERPEYDERQERLSILQKNGLSRKLAACYRRRIERVSNRRLSSAIVRADPSYLADPSLACVIRPTLRKNGISAVRARCIARRVRGRSARTFVLLTLAQTKRSRHALNQRFRRAAARCS
jgi:hypothetical protein